MHALSEDLLESYILAPLQLDASTRTSIEQHLESCRACRRIEALLRAFHEELDRDDAEVPQVIDEFVDHLVEHR